MANVNETTDAAADRSTTYAIAEGRTAHGRITVAGDSDWFRVDLTAEDTYTFALVGTGLSTEHLHDARLFLRNASGAVIASDDSGSRTAATVTYGSPATPAPYVSMANVNETTDAAAGKSTTYAIAEGQTAHGRIAVSGDADWFKVNLTAGQTYTFALVGTGLSTEHLHDPKLFLRNASGAVIASDDDSGPGLNSTITFSALASGSYYLDVQSKTAALGDYTLSAIAGSKASYDADMAAGALARSDLSWSAPGTAATVTYGFRDTPAPYGSTKHDISTFTHVPAEEKAAIQLVLQLLADVCNITFTPVNPGGYTDNATILYSNYADPDDGSDAFAFQPGSTASNNRAGDVWFDTTGGSTTELPVGSRSFAAIIHETGHALGLSHPGDYDVETGAGTYAEDAQFTQDSKQYSVMSYFHGANTGARYSGSVETPMLFDISSLQLVYGANMTTRAGDTTYGFGGTGPIFDFAVNTQPMLCIWDAGGVDTLDCSGFTQSQSINLNAGAFSNVGGGISNVSIAFGATLENARGGSGNDLLTGNGVANTLEGGGGNDILMGGAGSDTFVYHALSDRGTVGDTVNDFVRGGGGDVLDLREVLQSFAGYNGANAFSGGYLQFNTSSGNTAVRLDSDGGANSFVTLATLTNVLLLEGDTSNYVI